ncbi:MAG: PQQ-like beta-propeller repeat protein [Bacteroidetes bacterium]|nr:PQQ-like beta-propeller repeat protein [Bacteroidota bacterium]
MNTNKLINWFQQFGIIFLLLVSAYAESQNVTQFRGNDRNGKYKETNLMTSWPATGPKLLWENDAVGNGYGSPVISNDIVYINGEVDSVGYLFAIDKTGKLLWKSAYGNEWVKSYPGSRSAPTIIGDLIYVTSGLGRLNCLNLKDGSRKWKVEMIQDLHGRYALFGHAESPLVYDDKVILIPGGRDTNVVALNRFTGKIEWISKGKGDVPGYNSPILIQVAGKRIIVTFTAYHMLGLDANSGELLWSHEQLNVPVAERQPGYGDTHSNSVFYEEGYIYYVAGDGNGAVKLKLSADGSRIEQVWRNPLIDDYMGGFIKIGDKIYTGKDSRKNLVCINAQTGIEQDSLKIGCGATILADNLLYYYNQRGEMNLVKPGEKMEKISSFKVSQGTKEHFCIPVIANGILYIRHGRSLMAYDIKNQ